MITVNDREVFVDTDDAKAYCTEFGILVAALKIKLSRKYGAKKAVHILKSAFYASIDATENDLERKVDSNE